MEGAITLEKALKEWKLELMKGTTLSGETCMKPWLELDSGIHLNDGYAKVSGGGNPEPPPPLSNTTP